MNKVQHRNARSTNKAPSRRRLVTAAVLPTVTARTPEALLLAHHTAITCPTCGAAEESHSRRDLPCLADYCPTGQHLFLQALRAQAALRRAERAAGVRQ